MDARHVSSRGAAGQANGKRGGTAAAQAGLAATLPLLHTCCQPAAPPAGGGLASMPTGTWLQCTTARMRTGTVRRCAGGWAAVGSALCQQMHATARPLLPFACRPEMWTAQHWSMPLLLPSASSAPAAWQLLPRAGNRPELQAVRSLAQCTLAMRMPDSMKWQMVWKLMIAKDKDKWGGLWREWRCAGPAGLRVAPWASQQSGVQAHKHCKEACHGEAAPADARRKAMMSAARSLPVQGAV